MSWRIFKLPPKTRERLDTLLKRCREEVNKRNVSDFMREADLADEKYRADVYISIALSYKKQLDIGKERQRSLKELRREK